MSSEGDMDCKVLPSFCQASLLGTKKVRSGWVLV